MEKLMLRIGEVPPSILIINGHAYSQIGIVLVNNLSLAPDDVTAITERLVSCWNEHHELIKERDDLKAKNDQLWKDHDQLLKAGEDALHTMEKLSDFQCIPADEAAQVYLNLSAALTKTQRSQSCPAGLKPQEKP